MKKAATAAAATASSSSTTCGRGGRVGWLVSWCFKPSQPQRIISGLMETFIKRYIVERTNEAEIRPEEQSEKVGSCRGEFME